MLWLETYVFFYIISTSCCLLAQRLLVCASLFLVLVRKMSPCNNR